MTTTTSDQPGTIDPPVCPVWCVSSHDANDDVHMCDSAERVIAPRSGHSGFTVTAQHYAGCANLDDYREGAAWRWTDVSRCVVLSCFVDNLLTADEARTLAANLIAAANEADPSLALGHATLSETIKTYGGLL